MKVVLFAVVALLAPACLAEAPENSAASIEAECAELPFNSFPPNQLLREETKDGGAVSVLHADTTGSWCEFFIEVEKPGTYSLTITSPRGPEKGISWAVVDGNLIGGPMDLYAPSAGQTSRTTVGKVTFLKPGNYPFRFVVAGKNAASSGYAIALQRISLEPTQGFTLLSPNGSSESDGNVLLHWNAWPGATRYRVEMDGLALAEVDAPATSYRTSNLGRGTHRWRVVALGPGARRQIPSRFPWGIRRLILSGNSTMISPPAIWRSGL